MGEKVAVCPVFVGRKGDKITLTHLLNYSMIRYFSYLFLAFSFINIRWLLGLFTLALITRAIIIMPKLTLTVQNLLKHCSLHLNPRFV